MKTILKMYEHLHWANQRLLETLKNRGEANDQAKRLFSHILLAEQEWINRIKRLECSPQGIWTELGMEECFELIEKNDKNFTGLLTGLSDFDALIHYKNSTGKEFTTSVRDILTHVALHGQYHRGQINQQLRENAFEPANIDFITFVR